MTTPAPLRPGVQLAAAEGSTRVVVVRAPAENARELTCGGAPMIPAPPGRPEPSAGDAVTVLGKRYVDADDTVEVLCTSSGPGELGYGGIPMTLKAAKPLPASD
ncbi:hypothetical protein ACLBYD_24370 [Rhodococcus sp. C26F]